MTMFGELADILWTVIALALLWFLGPWIHSKTTTKKKKTPLDLFSTTVINSHFYI